MVKFITFGKINNQYKYILIYISIRIVNDYIFSEIFPKQIRPNFFYSKNYPPSILVQTFFNYLGSFIFSIILYLYEKFESKKEKKDGNKTQRDSVKKYKLIYKNKNFPFLKLKTIIITTSLSIIVVEILNISYIVGFMGLLYWVFDIFFVSYINLLMFDMPIYSHKKCAIIFMVAFSFLFKLLSTIEFITNDKYNLFYKNHIILIPILIIFYICLSLIRFYSICKIKWLLDYRFISVKIFYIIYNLLGTIILLIACLIADYIKCVDKKTINDIDLICLVKIETGKTIEYYFDNFSYYFEHLWKKDINTWMNIFYLFLFILQLLLNALRILYIILIIRHLSPEFYLCTYDIYYIIIRTIGLINAIINNGDVLIEVYNVLTELGALVGILIYLELIELNFWNLNRNLKKNIITRSEIEYNINDIETEAEELEIS